MIAIGGLRERLLGSIVSGDAARNVALGSAPPKYSAYLELIQGLRVFTKNQAASRAYFRRAIALDSALVPAYGVLAATYTNARMFDTAERVIAVLDGQRAHLSSYDRLSLEFLHVHNHYIADEILPLAQETYARGQDPLYAYLTGFGRFACSSRAWRSPRCGSPTRDDFSGWVGQARDVALAQHQLGDYKAELAALERGARLVRLCGIVSK